MPKAAFSDIVCSIARTVDAIGERWTPLILRDLFVGLTRFEDIRRDLGIASNVLAARLDALQEHGIVERRAYQSNPVRYEYLLTERGRDLYPVLTMLITWGDKWLAGAGGPPAVVVHRDCGRPTRGVVVCQECGKPLTADNVRWLPGPGGQQGPGTMLIGDRLEGEGASS
ncbi:helix-turn-helix transcriptional regulator [Nocardia sp. NBC_00508]|uniref:winged helix-turn-helix transcriptional regulator n=1 Tax=Nocardia sp. NBC_00508 TaxID=2975992 RepID=UPI002E808A52|nr:helix-turn-helix domain-containing protein [Nocardia sp. NBC_00508]WUD65338.1 helix-turn-helix transcriptional regulator [Nocardia sp. NBC_00508]